MSNPVGQDANSRGLDRQTMESLLQQYSSIPSTASTESFEYFLQNTLSDLQARKQVEATLTDMVKDVEFSVNLQEQLLIQTHQNQAERIIAQQELALQETHIVEKARWENQTSMADELVKDLWTLSKEVGSLLELKQKHEAMILEYDELTAKLAQAEEDLRVARTRPQQAPVATAPQPTTQTVPGEQKPAAQPASVQKPPSLTQVATDAKAPMQATATVVKIPEKKSAPLTEAPEKPAPRQTEAAHGATKAEGEVEISKPKAQSESSASMPVVALVEDDHDGGDAALITLENIEMEILMRIFGFLDAYDILNTAQVNISMYSRVDSLFGFGMEAPMQDDAASTTSTLATTPTVAAATQKSATTTTASVSSNATAKSTFKPAPSATKQAEHQFGHRLVGGGRNLLNMLQGGGGRNDGSHAAAADASKRPASPKRGGRGPGGRSRGGSDAGDSKPPLSEAMAHSMAAKLNDSEINAIISMTEKLRSKEKQVSLLIREKEELEGKLNGSEAVKDFLITKVRDMEKIMNKSDETEKKVTQQIASDQEVIAFLDGRVQELERMTRIMQKEKNATQEKLKAVVAQNDKKVAVLSDMLQFERQKLKENEREWKATKKLLVKEVKGCRAQIVALQAERDGFREQNDALRKAVMAGGSSSNGGRSSSPHR